MSFRSNQTLSGLLNLLPTIQYAFWFYFLFFVLFPHFDQLKCVVCVYVVCCVKRLMQAFHMSMQSWSYTVLSLHHEYQTFPLAAPPAIIFFPPGAIWRMPPRAYAGVFWCNKTGSALSLCYHDAKFITFPQVNLRLSVLSETQAYKSSDNNPPQASMSTMC